MIRVAVVGLGWWGLKIVDELASCDELEVVIGIDPSSQGRDAGARRSLQVADNLENACRRPDIDAVILCSPHKFHAEQIVVCAQAGKHAFCEKPLTATGDSADFVIATMRDAGLVLGIGHERRFEAPVLALRDLVAGEGLGQLVAMEGNFSQDKFVDLPRDNWRLSAVEAPVGPLSATGIHLVDLAINLFGRPQEVWANLSHLRAGGFPNGDSLAISLRFGSGGSALLTASLTTPFYGRIAVFGSNGWAEIRDKSHPDDPQGWTLEHYVRGARSPVRREFAPHSAVRDNLVSFARAVAGGEPYPVSGAEMSANAHAFEAIAQGALTGAVVQVPAAAART